MNTLNKAKLVKLVALLWLCGVAPALHAAPGTLSDSPLFLSTSVEPNIFWTVDDSGSMDWEVLSSTGISGRPLLRSTYSNFYILPSANNDYDEYWITNYNYYPYTIPSEASEAGTWKARNSTFNALYYNPEITYEAWSGSDAVGSPMYSNANAAAALVDPTNASAGTLNLTADFTYKNWSFSGGSWYDDTIYPAQYYTWTDTDGDGVVEDTDAHAQVKIISTTATYTGSSSRTDCASAPTCTYAEEIQNFANWYQYYRKREYAGKAAVGNIVQGNSSARMGMQVFNGGLVSNATSMSVTTDKVSLLNNVYGLSMPCTTSNCPGTPARTSLKSVGDLFEGGSSPILSSTTGGTCQQNFNVLITDGYWNGSSPSLGNKDGDNNTDYDGGYYADTYSDTLADVAMHYYERDLKTGLDDRVPTTPGVDEADHQHLVTYTVAFGVSGSLDHTTQDPSDTGFAWPNPASGDIYKVDDLWHTAYNGRGLYLNAQNPTELVSSLESALENIDDRSGSAAAVAFNTNTLSTGSAVFLVLFNSNRWSGSVYKYALDPFTGAVSSTITWEASDVLDNRNLSSDPRVVLTHNGTDGVAFQWANLTTAQQNDLKTNPAGGTDADAKAQARLNYIRGDRTNEGSGYNFRTRSSRLGDIVHSNPVYVSEPSMSWPDASPFPATDTTKYSYWKELDAVKNRAAMLYVGANDGMMHGFRSSDGAETLAYIPADVFSTTTNQGLHYLTDPAYLHRYYVDLPPTVTDAYVKVETSGGTAWRTLLLGGQRAGGKSIFAMDITYPSNFSESNAADLVLWEFTESDLGYTYSEPTVALMNDGKWAAIFGNGYNDSGSGEAQLFIVYLEGGLDGTWTSGTDYIKISTGSGSTSNRNGLSTPAVIDTDGDGVADRVYAGDLYGDLWAFDLSSTNASQWKVAYKQGSTYKPLYDGLSTQPITVEPLVANHPTETGSPNYMIYFGTGQYLVDGDKTSTDTQSFYGIWDHGVKELERSDLIEQTFETGFASNVRVLSDNAVDYSSNDDGWYIDLPTSTERVVVNPVQRGEIVYFNTLISSTDPCTYGGSGWLMGVDMATGGRPSSDNIIFDVNGDGVVDSTDLLTNGDSSVSNAAATGIQYAEGIPAESAFLGDYQYTPGTNTDDGSDIKVNKVQDLGDGETGRLSWEEITLD